jgi:class 3 adenylate cyclase/predicted ATPase
MDELEKWLTPLGLEALAPTLRASDIDLDILPALTESDLEKLGISLGYRRKLLRATANLLSSSSSAEVSARPSANASAERRQLTVMFCDLVGSTALSARVDPEDMREIIDIYYRCTSDIITKSGGFVGRYVGDGVLAYFGYPQAHEDDVERAVRAALSLVEVVPTAHDAGLQVRVGIATGVVVVGDLVSEGWRGQGVVGDTPNLAARLQAVAQPGQIVISQSTRRLAGGHFEYGDLGRLALKGLSDPVPAWQVLGASTAESRFAAQHETSLSPFVGRQEELDLLLHRWWHAKEGRGSVVLLSGEPGIGKSRVAQALLERLSGEPHVRVRYFCSPHHQDTAFYPIITHLERAAGFRRDDSVKQRLDKLEVLLAQSTQDISEAAPLFAELLSIPAAFRHPRLDLSPQRRKEKTLQALMAHVQGLTAEHPLLLVSEDVHWSDRSSLEALDMIVDRVPALPILVIVTFRPEFTPPWIGRPHVSSLSLTRLPLRHSAELIAGVTEGKALPKEIADQIVTRTDGVPLFIEELTKAVVESGVLVDVGDRYVATGPLPPMSIPMTLHASLLARLDHFAPAREVAQIGAALGRQFSHELISAVAPMAQEKLDDALAQLVGAELIYRHGSPPDAEYTFKHALVQDAAYSTLLRARRLQLHGRIVAILENQFPEMVASQPQLIAQHCAEAGFHEKAVEYRIRAGQLAARRSAMTEAEAQLRKGLDLLANLPDSSARHERELELQIALARALIATQGHAAPAVALAQARARQLWERLGQPPQSWVVNQFEYRLTRAELTLARQEARDVLDLANPLTTIAGCNMTATVSFFLGEFTAGCVYGQHALDLCDAEHRDSSNRAAIYRQTVARSYLFLSKFYLGYVDQARLRCEETRAGAQVHAFSLALAIACSLYIQSEPMVLAQRCEELEAHGAEHGFPIFVAHATVLRGSALSALGRAEEGFELLTKGLTAYRATGAALQVPRFLTDLAQGCGRCGRANEGLEYLDEAARLIERTDERWVESYMLRMRGELLVAVGERERAEASLLEAIAVAHRQKAKMWELRAAKSLARFWSEVGKGSEARNLLAPICGWFAEGLDTPDLTEAKSLLDELA